MNFQRAVTIAVMTDFMVSNSGIAANLFAIAVGAVLWYFAGDPIPQAIERGLEDFARKHRRGGR